MQGQDLWIDGYNVLTSIEAALSGGVILKAQDGCYRDMASMHGSYRKVEETIPAIQLIGRFLEKCQVKRSRWLLDRPVSNSGRLKSILDEQAARHEWAWGIELVPDPDRILADCGQIVATADSGILDRIGQWFNLVRLVIDEQLKESWLIDLSSRRIE